MGVVCVAMSVPGTYYSGPRATYHRAGPSYRGECAFSPPVVPHLPRPYAAAPQGNGAPPPYPDLAGSTAMYTRDHTPGKFLAKACQGNIHALKVFLAQRGDINVQLEENELQVLLREVGGDCLRGNPSKKSIVGDIELG